MMSESTSLARGSGTQYLGSEIYVTHDRPTLSDGGGRMHPMQRNAPEQDQTPQKKPCRTSRRAREMEVSTIEHQNRQPVGMATF